MNGPGFQALVAQRVELSEVQRKDAKVKTVQGLVEDDESFIRKSAKGSKRLIGRATRKRGMPAKAGTV